MLSTSRVKMPKLGQEKNCTFIPIQCNSKRDISFRCIYCFSDKKKISNNIFSNQCCSVRQCNLDPEKRNSQLCETRLIKVQHRNNYLGQIVECVKCFLKYQEPVPSFCERAPVMMTCKDKKCVSVCTHLAFEMTFTTDTFLPCSFKNGKYCEHCKEKPTDEFLKNLSKTSILCRARNETRMRSAKTVLENRDIIKTEVIELDDFEEETEGSYDLNQINNDTG